MRVSREMVAILFSDVSQPCELGGTGFGSSARASCVRVSREMVAILFSDVSQESRVVFIHQMLKCESK